MTNALGQDAEQTARQDHADDHADALAELAALRTLVDELDAGIVVLNKARHVQFANRAFRRFWRVPDELAESRPTFLRLMHHGGGFGAYEITTEKLNDSIAKQLERVRTGDQRPLEIRLGGGRTVQFRCKALPDGGRLLSYGNVTELAEQAEAQERLASSDGLTGLNNRRHFLALAESEWSRFQRYGRPFALLMIDIDLFKSLIERHGRDGGDAVIKAVTAILQKHKRASDIAGRLGTEEFAVLLPEARLDSAITAAERLRQLVAADAIVVDGWRVSVTVSIGVSAADSAMSGFDDLLKQADIALYDAKRSGGNRVCRIIPEQPAGSPGGK